MYIKLKIIFGAFISLGLAMPAFAIEREHKSYDYFISLSVGSNWTSTGTTQYIELQPDLVNAYVSQSAFNHRVLANGELVLGAQTAVYKALKTQLGLAFYASSPAIINGYIQVDGDPNFQNYSDQYRINHEHIAFKSKLILENAYHIDPYVSGSVGVGFNRSYGYSMTPLIFQAIAMPPFQSNTQASLSYTAGAGIQHHLGQHLSFALGYYSP